MWYSGIGLFCLRLTHWSRNTTVCMIHHIMETFSALLAICAGNSPVNGEFPAQRPVTWSFDVFFNPPLNIRVSKHLAYIHHWFRQWIDCRVTRIEPFREPVITYCELNLKNKLHWNMTQNTTISQGNTFQKPFCQMSAIFVEAQFFIGISRKIRIMRFYVLIESFGISSGARQLILFEKLCAELSIFHVLMKF